MKQGRSLWELATELERQRKTRKDFVADTRSLEVKTSGIHTVVSLDLEQTVEKFILSELAISRSPCGCKFRTGITKK